MAINFHQKKHTRKKKIKVWFSFENNKVLLFSNHFILSKYFEFNLYIQNSFFTLAIHSGWLITHKFSCIMLL